MRIQFIPKGSFTAEEAFEASVAGDPFLLTERAVRRVCLDHGTSLAEYDDDYANRHGMVAAEEWALKCDEEERICRNITRRLQRNEQAQYYHWKSRNLLAPTRISQRL